VRVLYGLKSAGTALRNYLDDCTSHLGWKTCHTDHDLWMKAETRPEDGVVYWAYILIYFDDFLCVHHNPGTPLAKLDENFKMKEHSMQIPTFYLDAKLKKTVLPNGVVSWGISSINYVQSDVQDVQEYLASLPGENTVLKKAPALFAGGYKPELDESTELDPVVANFFLS
jgi:hypothetical protein